MADVLGPPTDEDVSRECEAGGVETWCVTHSAAWDEDEDRCVRVLVGWYHRFDGQGRRVA